MKGWRWDAGRLVVVACELPSICIAKPLPFSRRLLPYPEQRRAVGIYACDLARAREAALPGGPPTWFRPNHSRRRRWALWHAATPWERTKPADPLARHMKLTTLHAHRVRYEWPCGRGRPFCEPPIHEGRRDEALLYLPPGQTATDADTNAVAVAMGWEPPPGPTAEELRARAQAEWDAYMRGRAAWPR